MKGAAPEFHEKFEAREDVRGSSDRVFGMTFAAVLMTVGVIKFLSGAGGALIWVGSSLCFLAVAVGAPRALGPLNRAWFTFGKFLNAVVTPVILAILFFGVFSPIGIAMRIVRRRPLRVNREPESQSYWIMRDESSPRSLRWQF